MLNVWHRHREPQKIADPPDSALFSLIFPSQLTQFNSRKTRERLWENLCPLCAPIISVHIWVQTRAWITQLPPTWTGLIPACLAAAEMTQSTAWIHNGAATLIPKCAWSSCWVCTSMPPHPRWFTKVVLYLQERHLERFISWHVAWRWIQSEVL